MLLKYVGYYHMSVIMFSNIHLKDTIKLVTYYYSKL